MTLRVFFVLLHDMYIDVENCCKAKVIKIMRSKAGIRKTVIKEGIAIGTTSHGAFIYDPKEQVGNPQWAEWFPFNSPAGIHVVLLDKEKKKDRIKRQPLIIQKYELV